jgi:hypothetical protein
VVFTVPSITRCYQCTTTSRHQDQSQSRSLNYGTGRLRAEPALGVDIQHVVTASAKIAIGLLQLDDESSGSSSRNMVYGALTAGFNYLIISMVPNYAFFPKVFTQTPGQHAYQAVWLQALGDNACPVCGPSRIDPMQLSGNRPNIAIIRAKAQRRW